MKKVLLVFGTRTETIKMAPFVLALKEYTHKIPAADLELDLHTGDIYSPWPEEVNSKLMSQIRKYHFTPTKTSKKNFLKENVDPITTVDEVNKLLKDKALYKSMSQAHNPYGDGKACYKIVNLIKENYAK